MAEENKKEYEGRYVFNKTDLVASVNRAKKKRTLQEFADAINAFYKESKKVDKDLISVATLSRITTGNIKRSISADLIAAIVGSYELSQRETEEDREYLENDLLRANGMVLVGSKRDERSKEDPDYFKSTEEKNIYLNALDEVFKVYEEGMTINGALLEVSAWSGGSYKLYKLEDIGKSWLFVHYNGGFIDDTSYAITDTNSRLSKIFLMDAWEGEKLEGMKVSAVFLNHTMFDAYVDAMRGKVFNMEFSVLFFDPKLGEFVDEYRFERTDGRSVVSIFNYVGAEKPKSKIEITPKDQKFIDKMSSGFASLTPNERDVFFSYSGMLDGSPKTIEEIAESKGFSIEDTLKILDSALVKLKEQKKR